MLENESQQIEEKAEFTYTCLELTEVQLVEWRIKDFNSLQLPTGKCIVSPYYPSKLNKCYKYYFKMYASGCKEEHQNKICTYIYMDSNEPVLIEINCKCEILNGRNEVLIPEYHLIGEITDCRGCGYFDCRDKLLFDDGNSRLFDGTLVLRCRFTGTWRTSEGVIAGPEAELTEDIGKLLGDESTADIDIVVGEKTFKAHKLVLQARSPVFAAMFSSFKEGLTNRVEVEDLDASVVDQLLEFLYTDKASRIGFVARELLEAADKYAIDSLKTKCCNWLLATLTDDNAVSTLVLAERHSCNELRDLTLEYIAQSPKLRAVESPDWDQLVNTNPTLLRQILRSSLK